MKKFSLWFSVMLVVSFMLYYAICSYTYSEGSRSGILLKFSKKGYVFKTYEGDLNAGILNTNVLGLTANMWNFSVTSDCEEAILALQTLEGRQVKLYYHQKIKAMPWQGETNNLVYKVEALKN
ncbi:MAG: 6-phosphogluconate dehydrogenase [bacterium]|nr:6-phosphogluconate dehydrogenase [bacterium]